MISEQLKLVRWATVCVLAGVGCGDGGARSHTLPWEEGGTQVLEADGSVRNVPTPAGSACLDIAGECVQPQLTCEGRGAELVLGSSGELVQTVCYPAGDTLTVEEIGARGGDVDQTENNAVILLDNLDDGVDIAGDLSLDANNVVVYGENPANAVISGGLSVDGNNAIVRGVRIQGDVEILKNNAVLLHCVIEGNLTIHGNNTVLAGCDVFGSITVYGNNTKLVGNRIAGPLVNPGKNTECDSNVAAVDANEDRVLAATEVGAALSCGE